MRLSRLLPSRQQIQPMKLQSPEFRPKPRSQSAGSGERAQVATLFDDGTFRDIKKEIGNIPANENKESPPIKEGRNPSGSTARYLATADEEQIRKSMKDFAKDLGEIHQEFEQKEGEDQVRYAGKLQTHVQGISDNPGTVSHDMDIVFRESLRFLNAKALNHADSAIHKEIGTKIIEKLYEHFPDYIEHSDTYQEIFRGRGDGTSNSKLAQETYNDLAQRLDGVKRQATGEQTDKPVRVEDLYTKAAVKLINAEKPKYKVDGQYVAYIPAKGRRDMHAHIHQNYDPTKSYPYGFKWADDIGRQAGVVGTTAMPIPHHIIKKKPGETPKDYAYYTDPDVLKTVFASFDQSMIKAFNELDADQQRTLVMASTGIEMMPGEDRMGRLNAAAEAFSHNVTLAKLQAGEKNILVFFGELTTNKPQVPQEMIGSDPRTYVDNSVQLQLALFKAAQSGALRALDTLPEKEQEKINVQIRLVIHTDTEKAGKKLSVEKISEDNEKLRDIPQPTVKDLAKVCTQIEKNLGELKHPRIRHVVQLAHFAGVNTVNWSEKDARRTRLVNALVKRTRRYDNLEVLMDTSWLTASARYINTGMGEYLKEHRNKDVQQLGERFLRADKIANDGFMFFSAGERHFQARLAAGDRSAEVIDGLALMRESCDRCTESYFRELGGIYADLQNKPGLADKVRHHVEKDSKPMRRPSEGNYVGMLLKQYKGKAGKQAQVPFVWGGDGLTQFAEPSGANKFFMYANQLGPVETLMEQLGVDSSGKPVGNYHPILQSLKMGDEREQKYWDQVQDKNTVSTDGIPEEGALDQKQAPRPNVELVDNVAAHHIVESPHALSLKSLNQRGSVIGNS